MSAAIDFQGTYTFEIHYHAAGTVAYHPEAYTSVDIADDGDSRVSLYFHSMEQADAFARAGLANLDVFAHGDKDGAS